MNAELRQVRAFNRLITQRIGVLNERYLGRDRPLAESRLLYEIGAGGAAVRDLRARLGLDSGFLSRLLRSLERQGLAASARRPADGRVKLARLTRAGLAELRRLDARSDDLARSLLEPLSRPQSQRLVAAMGEVERLLRVASIELHRADPDAAAARYCQGEYCAELARRFKGGFDPAASGFAAARAIRDPHEHLLVASLFGEPVGCAALRALGPGVGEIKRMWVSPKVRGCGLGRRLLQALETVARQSRMRTLRLDTNASLNEALGLYRSSGYREIAPYNQNPYAQHWFAKALR